jgi:glycosyltransferase involved in cell wall biosynthesis
LTSRFIDLHAVGRRRFFAEAEALFRSRRYDIAHAFVGTANLYTRWAAMKAGMPAIMGGWRKSRAEESTGLWLLYSFLNRWSSTWIVNSSPSAEALGTLFGRRSIKTYIVPNALELARDLRTECAALPGEIAEWIGGRRSVAILGRAESSKNYDLFIDIAASVTSENDGVCFVLIAATDHTPESRAQERRLRERISGEGLSKRVLYTGRLDDAASLLGNFSLFLFTSDHEGCPNAVIEAMAAGLPIVMTRCTDTQLLVDEGKNGFTCSKSVEELSRRVKSILSDTELMRGFGEHSRALAVRNFDSADSAWTLARIYLEEWHLAMGES